MIGIWSAYANIFLYIVGGAMLVVYGLPLMVAPLWWAKIFGWKVLQADNLTVTLGRSLGIVISLIAVFAFEVTNTPAARPFFFDMMTWLIGAMTILHVYGAIRKLQPKLETIEIILWVVLFLLTICFYPA